MCYMKIALCLSAILMLLPTLALSEETYKFERMWPTLQQPWYFHAPDEIAIDSKGNVYVVDAGSCRIHKIGPDGTFITRWGMAGAGDGEFDMPRGIAIDNADNVYVVDTGNNRIQKFTSDGTFMRKWGAHGDTNGNFSSPTGIAISNEGDVYVVDTGNNRIQKFDKDGVFLAKWGKQGSEDGSFSVDQNCISQGIGVDTSGNVYVVDSGNYRVQKFTAEGGFITKWSGFGEGNGEFNSPDRMALDDADHIFVLDHNPGVGVNRIQKFNSDGSFVSSLEVGGIGDGHCTFCTGMTVADNTHIYLSDFYSGRVQKIGSDGVLIFKWGTDGSGKGEFHKPAGIAMDSDGNVYVSDSLNHRIQKFSTDGVFIAEWGSFGAENGQLNWPEGIAVDKSDNIYVADHDNHRIQKFDANGVFLSKWGSYGTGNGEFNLPTGIAVDISGNVYVSELANSRIQKFSPNGEFITQWGTPGAGNGQFGSDNFIDIAVSYSGYVYVLDSGNNRVQKFDLNGAYVAQWGTPGASDGEFFFTGAFTGDPPNGITVDGSGNIYVVDAGNYRIQKFTGSGEFITKFGAYGYDQGELTRPSYICAGTSGRVYVSDFGTNRIQVFSTEGSPVSGISKAIIVAGGGPYTGNNLWEVTQMCANYAYRALTYQGYSKESIYYVSADMGLDLDGNGILDDVDANATNANMQYAIKTWANDAEALFIYMVDHGGNGTFRMGETELLGASDLDSWLDSLQQTISGSVTMVYDACESGSFLPLLTPPAGKQRIWLPVHPPVRSPYL
jgi:sugar lactone lactonase YvrE